MRILLTGGTGFIGKALGQALVARGHELVVLTRNPEKARQNSPYPARFFAWEGSRDLPPREALRDIEAVAHLAGESIAQGRWTSSRKAELKNSRVLTTQNLLKGFSEAGSFPQVFVSASAIGYYGFSEGQVFTEDSPAGEDFAAQLCEQWEQEVHAIKAFSDSTRLAIIRIGLVLGEGGGILGKLVPLFRRRLGSVLGNGRQVMSWIDLGDLIRLWVEALESNKFHGVYNAVAPRAVTNKELTQQLAHHLNVGLLPATPSFVLEAVLGELADLLLKGARVESKRLAEVGFTFSTPDFASSLKKNVVVLQPGEQQVVFEQWVPHQREEIFPFFESEGNLGEITPPWLRFRIIGKNTPSLQIGTRIDYELRLHGLPIKWKTEITHWKKNEMFIDCQLQGPYKKWVHCHEFEDLGGGTLIRDRITYKVPLGLLGRMVAGYYVAGNVEEIFGYRRGIIAERFGLT